MAVTAQGQLPRRALFSLGITVFRFLFCLAANHDFFCEVLTTVLAT